MHIATVGNTIQTVNSPMYDTYMSTPGNTAKDPHTATYRQHKEVRPWLGANLQCISQHTTESALYPLCQPGIAFGELKLDQTWFKQSTSTFMPG